MRKENKPAYTCFFIEEKKIRKYKQTLMDSTRQDGKVYRLLRSGKCLTGREISVITDVADPNAVIKRLRDRGVMVSDFPQLSNPRRKVFFLRELDPYLTICGEKGGEKW